MARARSRRKPREEWLALRPGTHEGYVDWERSEAIRRMVSDNIPNSRHHGAAKHGDALLAGLIRCQRCGRKLTIRYTGTKHNIPRYSCTRGWLDNGEPRCIAFGGLRVDDAIEAAILKVVEPSAITAAIEADAREATRRDEVRDALIRDLEARRYAAELTALAVSSVIPPRQAPSRPKGTMRRRGPGVNPPVAGFNHLNGPRQSGSQCQGAPRQSAFDRRRRLP
jgi:hypothetical protein